MSRFQTLTPSSLSREAFVEAFADIYEHSPWVAEKAYDLGDLHSLDEIETLQIADVNARTSALRTGSIDVMTNVDLKTVSLLKRSPDVRVIESKGNEHITLPMLTDVAPFDNNDLRLALKYAIDREQWLKTIFKGYGSLGNDHPIGAANQYLDTSIEQRMYDPDKAKHHLKKAGYDSIDLKLHMSSTAFDGAVDAGQLYQESAKASGVNIARERLIAFVADRPGHDLRYAIDPARLRADFGWRPSVTLEEGLRRTVRWYLDNESWWRPLQERQGVGQRLGVGK